MKMGSCTYSVVIAVAGGGAIAWVACLLGPWGVGLLLTPFGPCGCVACGVVSLSCG